MAKRKQKATDPEVARLLKRAQDLAAVGLHPEAAALKQHDSVEVTRTGDDTKGGKTAGHDVARRMDAFDALRGSMAPGCFDACKRLERDVLLAALEGDRGPRAERVDNDRQSEPEFRFIVAADNVRFMRQRLSRRDFWLLHELIKPDQDRPNWRDGVAYVTGEENPNAQGAAVRAASENLRDAYKELDEGGRRAAA